jgi:hypothetical protein
LGQSIKDLSTEKDYVGRVIKKQDGDELITSTPPVIKDNTYVVAICGTLDI